MVFTSFWYIDVLPFYSLAFLLNLFTHYNKTLFSLQFLKTLSPERCLDFICVYAEFFQNYLRNFSCTLKTNHFLLFCSETLYLLEKFPNNFQLICSFSATLARP